MGKLSCTDASRLGFEPLFRQSHPGALTARKVASLKAAVDQGSYQVNSEALADKLISHQADLMRASKRSS